MKVDNKKIRVGEQVTLQVPAVLVSRTIRETLEGTEVLSALYETTQNVNTANKGRWSSNGTIRGARFTAKTLAGKSCTVERAE